MKRLFKTLSASILALLLVFSVMACEGGNNSSSSTPAIDPVDYVAQHQFNPDSGRVYQEVSVKLFVDGDTTHFNASQAVNGKNVIKSRYLAINTPESTGKIEDYGKTASRFTKEKLSNAVSIIVESDSDKWEFDSTGDRILSWVWYQPAEGAEYRLLNLEILQEGLAIASNTANNTYGEICLNALNQAKALKLYVHSGVVDPEIYTGEAINVTLKELRENIEYYNGLDVAFEGVITKDYNNGVYVEEYDEETDMYYAMYVYYGFNLSAGGLRILKEGNRVLIVGNVQYWEGGGTYQVTDLSYDPRDKENPHNLKLIEEGCEGAYTLTDADTFVNGTVSFETTNEDGEDVVVSRRYAELAMNTSISMQSLVVTRVYTTTNPDSDSKGAMTLTCKVGNITVTVRTDVLRDADGNVVTADAYEGKTIDVKGIIDYYDGDYQVKILSAKDIIVHD